MMTLKDIIKPNSFKGFDIDPVMAAIMPFYLGIDPADAPTLPFTIAASGTVAKPFGFQAPRNSVLGAFLGQYWTFADSTDGTASAAFTIGLNDLGGRTLTNRPVHIRTLAGSADLPSVIWEPLLMLSREKLSCQPNKISGGSTTMRMVCAGSYINPENDALNRLMNKAIERRKTVYPYWMTTEGAVSLTSLQTNVNFDIQVSEHFEMCAIAAVATGNFALTITETRTGKTLMNGAISNTNGLGDAKLPCILPKSYIIPAGSRLRLTFEDLSSGTNNVYINMHGRNIAQSVPINEITDALRLDDELAAYADLYRATEPELIGVM